MAKYWETLANEARQRESKRHRNKMS
jgi:hypothetical protein